MPGECSMMSVGDVSGGCQWGMFNVLVIRSMIVGLIVGSRDGGVSN